MRVSEISTISDAERCRRLIAAYGEICGFYEDYYDGPHRAAGMSADYCVCRDTRLRLIKQFGQLHG